MSSLVEPFRLAVRGLRRRPGLAAVVVAIFAVAVGGNAAIFSVVDAVLLDGVPYRDPRSLVTVDVVSSRGYLISTSMPNFRDWRDRGRVFADWGAAAGWDLTLRGEPAESLLGWAVYGDFFRVLGLDAAAGRLFTGTETEPGAEPLAVLGDGLWRRRFGGDPDVVGRTIVLDDRPHRVVGVLLPGAGYPSADSEVYIPMGSIPDLPWDDRGSSFGARAWARLAPGVTPETAAADLARVHREVKEEEGEAVATPNVVTAQDLFVRDARPRLRLLAGAVLAVLVVAAANVTGLFLVRGEARAGEVAIRHALGGGRVRVALPLVAEGVLLALAGGLVGVALAGFVLDAARSFLARDLQPWMVERLEIDGEVVAVALGLALAAGIVAGLVPALGGRRRDLAGALRERGGRGGSDRGRLRGGLVVVEVAIAVALLVGAGLLLTSLAALSRADLGFSPAGVLAARLQVPEDVAADGAAWVRFYEAAEAATAALPGVESAALSLLVPLSGRSWENTVYQEGDDLDDPEVGNSFLFGIVSETYFSTLRIPLRAGRVFAAEDRAGAPPVAVVDRTLAERYWPGEDAVGRRLFIGERTEAGEPIYRTVVGVVDNVRHYELASPSRIQLYVPYRQGPEQALPPLNVLARTSVPPATLFEPVREAMAGVDPRAPVSALTTVDELVDYALAPNRAVGVLVAGFSTVAVVLAALGVFGVLSWMVVRRLREIGVRMALGAEGRRLVAWIAGEALRLTGAGVVLGLVAAALLARHVEAFLYEVRPLDPIHYLAAGAALLAVGVLAAVLPARRAVAVDPTVVLRDG